VFVCLLCLGPGRLHLRQFFEGQQTCQGSPTCAPYQRNATGALLKGCSEASAARLAADEVKLLEGPYVPHKVAGFF
jgi:hypothetical protein